MTDRGGAGDPLARPGLAPRPLHGSVVAASDHFFAEAENLIQLIQPGSGGPKRRAESSGPDSHEWVVVRLAGRAAIEAVEIDTSGHTGDAPEAASLTAKDGTSGWSVLLESTPLPPDTPSRFRLAAPRTATHVRLNVFPGGGIARLRLYGTVIS